MYILIVAAVVTDLAPTHHTSFSWASSWGVLCQNEKNKITVAVQQISPDNIFKHWQEKYTQN